MSEDGSEKRRHPRIAREEILSIKLIAPPTSFSHQGEPIYCSTTNLSLSGMQLHMNEALSPGQEVDIWIVLGGDNHRTLNLTGEISWIRPQDNPREPGTYVAGLQLHATDSPDYQDWQQAFEELDPE